MTKIEELAEVARGLLEGIEKLKNEDKFEYPIFKKNSLGTIHRFTDITTSIIVFTNDTKVVVGVEMENRIKHTDTKIYSDVPYNKERDLYHGQVCYAWDDKDTHKIIIRFYDAINDCAFDYAGKSCGIKYDNYKAVPYEHIPQRMIEAYSSLEGI
jgi:hypothetical protein